VKQLIIARKDLEMSPGKLAAQVSHASMAFLTSQIRRKGRKTLKYGYSSHISFEVGGGPKNYKRADLTQWAKEAYDRNQFWFYTRPVPDQDDQYNIELCDPEYEYTCELFFDTDVYEDWIDGIFAKVVCEAKNRTHLTKAVQHATELGLKEGEDFFLIKDKCLTELEPEEIDENGVGRTLTCIGFRPLPDEIQQKISRKYQLYK
jgi:PTH2 family peptidyl-tRNA hydrolase